MESSLGNGLGKDFELTYDGISLRIEGGPFGEKVIRGGAFFHQDIQVFLAEIYGCISACMHLQSDRTAATIGDFIEVIRIVESSIHLYSILHYTEEDVEGTNQMLSRLDTLIDGVQSVDATRSRFADIVSFTVNSQGTPITRLRPRPPRTRKAFRTLTSLGLNEASEDTDRTFGDIGLFVGKKQDFSPKNWVPNPSPRYPGIGNIEADPPVPQPGKGDRLTDRAPMKIRGR